MYTSDQFSGFKNVVVTGALRDSLAVLEGCSIKKRGFIQEMDPCTTHLFCGIRFFVTICFVDLHYRPLFF